MVNQSSWYYKHIIWNKTTWQFIQLNKNPLGIQGQNDLGRSKGWINPHSSAELDRRCWASFCPAGFISTTWTNFRKFFLLLLWHLGPLLAQLFHLMSLLFCTFFCELGLTAWAVLQDTLHRYAGEWLTGIPGNGQLVMHFLQMGGYCFSVAPHLEAPGAERHIGASKGITQMQPLKTYHGCCHPLFIEMVIIAVVLFQWQYQSLHLVVGFGLWVSGVNFGVSGHGNVEKLVSPAHHTAYLKGFVVFHKSTIPLCLNAVMIMSPHGLAAVTDHFKLSLSPEAAFAESTGSSYLLWVFLLDSLNGHFVCVWAHDTVSRGWVHVRCGHILPWWV